MSTLAAKQIMSIFKRSYVNHADAEKEIEKIIIAANVSALRDWAFKLSKLSDEMYSEACRIEKGCYEYDSSGDTR